MITILQAAVAKQEGFMVKDGKIFLVMTIVSIILTGLLIYVASIDKKITKLEKNSKN